MKIYGLLLGLVVTGCSQNALVKPDPASVHYLPPVGSRVELHRPLSVPGGHTRVFLQGGEPVSKAGFDRYRPSCNFEIRSLSDQPREILPGSFLVTRVQRENAEVVLRPVTPVMLAGPYFAGRDDGLPMIVRSVHLWLADDRQPDLMRLTCRGGFDDPWDADPPSIEQMRRAIGGYASLELPE
jgi:hypothetical protein